MLYTCVHKYAHVQLLLFNLLVVAVANAYEEGEEVVVWSSGWSPEAVRVLATSSGSGMLGSWKVVMDGDFNDVPVSSLWSHRWVQHSSSVCFHGAVVALSRSKGSRGVIWMSRTCSKS